MQKKLLLGSGAVLFLLMALATGILLTRQRQLLLSFASCECYPDDTHVCSGNWFTKTCGSQTITCAGTKDCSVKGEATPTPTREAPSQNRPWCSDPGDKCNTGDTNCQKNNKGENTGYKCKCTDIGSSTCKKTVWSCGTYDSTACPAPQGGPVGFMRIGCAIDNFVWADSSQRCVIKVADPNNLSSAHQSFSAASFSCPNDFNTQNTPTGCNKNRVDHNGVTSVCFLGNFCGNQQIDFLAQSCTVSASDHINCSTTSTTTAPTHTPTPSTTPGTTPGVTPGVTPSVTPSETPQITITISITPLITPNPSPTTPPIAYLSPTPITPNPSPTTRPPDNPPAPPNSCNGDCHSDANCTAAEDGTKLVCVNNHCRHPSCTDQESCHCPPGWPASTPKPTPTQRLASTGASLSTILTALGGFALIGLGALLAL